MKEKKDQRRDIFTFPAEGGGGGDTGEEAPNSDWMWKNFPVEMKTAPKIDCGQEGRNIKRPAPCKSSWRRLLKSQQGSQGGQHLGGPSGERAALRLPPRKDEIYRSVIEKEGRRRRRGKKLPVLAVRTSGSSR